MWSKYTVHDDEQLDQGRNEICGIQNEPLLMNAKNHVSNVTIHISVSNFHRLVRAPQR